MQKKTCLKYYIKAFSILAHVRIKIHLEGGDILKIYPEGEDIMDFLVQKYMLTLRIYQYLYEVWNI